MSGPLAAPCRGGVFVAHNAVVIGDIAPIHVGENTNIQDGTVVHVSTKLREGTRIGAQGSKNW